jgi:N-methylhydantoinase A
MLTVAVDVGGTFTDIFVRDDESRAWVAHKTASTPPTFVEGFLRGVLEAVAKMPGKGPADVGRIVHGTTVGTNAILTQSGARIGFILTEGFRDILYIGLGWRPRMYDLQMDPVEPLFLAPRRRSLGVRERVDAAGNVVLPLDADHLREVGRELVDKHQVEVFVVCLLHSYANPAHERQARDVLREAFPAIPVTLSSDVLPRKREYRRLVVSGFDAYVKPVVTRYLQGIERQLCEAGINAPLQVMQSNGGISGVGTIIERPVRTVLSGLAAGVIGAAHVGQEAGHPDCISLDMGGTSADVALIRGGRPVITADGSFEDYPLNIPMVEVRTIGAGGSSIAYIDKGGGLRVGPRSAGANPGPACYGRSGVEPTVTDASLVLGYLNPHSFAGGIVLDVERSHAAIDEYVARPLGKTVPEAALGIHAIVNANMAQTMRLVSIKRGYDPRRFTFIPFGGAGPLNAGRLAEALGMRTVLVPKTPGVLSAAGLLLAPLQHDAIGSFERPLSETTVTALAASLSELEASCGARMRSEGGSAGDADRIEYHAEMRYVGQAHQIEIALPRPIDAAALASVAERFHVAHEATYGHADRAAQPEFVTLRVVQRRDPLDRGFGSAALPSAGDHSAIARRQACFDAAQGYVDVPVYWRAALPPGFSVTGPAIIEQSDTTTVVYPGHGAVIDPSGNLLISVPYGDRGS